ncbi:unnamed protein product [Rangifer tarandus platyrhynchus]|uniref:Uncharacterized protein n=1 Tax=Rangifer tarandus platyrhynchus TaxID=3082113 RepID=A0ABN8XIJ6_RANTA|nr:unnamed protein product [Rangifer tarandus platyrhynchus]
MRQSCERMRRINTSEERKRRRGGWLSNGKAAKTAVLLLLLHGFTIAAAAQYPSSCADAARLVTETGTAVVDTCMSSCVVNLYAGSFAQLTTKHYM